MSRAADKPTSPPASPDIDEIIQRAVAFQERIDAVKAQIQPRDFQWYPYDTWTNLPPINELLKGEQRYLLDLIGDNPVLDIGCADGMLSFFLESMGCTVHALDYPTTNHNDMRGVRTLKAALRSSVQIHEIDLDSQFRLPHEHYGLVFFLGILYHLKNPFYALETLARHAQYLIVSTRVARFSPDKSINYHRAPMAYLLGEREANNDPSNYWIFSHAGLRRLIQRTGWEICAYRATGNTRDSDPATWEGDERAFCLLKSCVLGPKWNASLLKGWHQLEHGRWRWTERQFSASFKIPMRDEPTTLHLRFALPIPLMERLGTVTIKASANGISLGPETYDQPGEFAYVRTIPAGAAGDFTRVDFVLDRALGPDQSDARERGIVVSFIGIE